MKSSNELGVLASAFNEMASTLERNFEEIKERQKELLTEKGKLETIVMSIADGVFVSNSDGIIISFNRAAEDISGYSEAEVKGLHCEEVFKTRLCEDACTLHNEDKIIRNKETEIITKDGRMRLVSVSSAILRDSDGKIIGGVQTFRDITKEKHRQAIMCQTEKLAAIGRLSAGLAHEINNPIGNVLGYAKLILKDLSMKEKQRERLKIILEQAEKASSIVQGLLNYSRQQEPKMEMVSINNVIESVIRLVSPQIEKRGINIKTDLKDVPAVKADFRQIEQVLFNIILNSIQAIGSDGEVRIHTSQTNNGFIEVRIEDTGPGIPKDHIHKIFDPFFTTKHVNEGTGLGLSVCMGMIKKHNGFIDVESEYGKRAAFIIKLTRGARMLDILVVDDDRRMRQLIEEILTENGFSVVTSGDGRDALLMLKERRSDIIITDLKMPHVDGMEILSYAKQSNPDALIVMITAYGTIESAIEAIKKGAYDYIQKPFDPDRLVLIIERAVNHLKLIYKNKRLAEKVEGFYKDDIIGSRAAIQNIKSLIEKVAPLDTTVLIHGETGTGKELVARLIHKKSGRADNIFLPVNCGALNETLLESELFGHEKGAFTGAMSQRKGLFETASGGTIFLDEINNTSPSMQVKLLRVLQENAIMRVGSSKPLSVDVRIIAASNINLSEETESGRFRKDLYYRLNVININIPPLRERIEDILSLLTIF